MAVLHLASQYLVQASNEDSPLCELAMLGHTRTVEEYCDRFLSL
jgi:hypothetical protein